MSNIPKFVEFRKEGPREGFQDEKRIYSTEEKVSLVDALSETGLRRVQVGAVRELVPQARIGLHLHDTRGVGPANFYAALQMGVDCFDSSVAAWAAVRLPPRRT